MMSIIPQELYDSYQQNHLKYFDYFLTTNKNISNYVLKMTNDGKFIWNGDT